MSNPSKTQMFKPYSIQHNTKRFLSLLFDEYEYLRFPDYEEMNQKQPAEKMNISLPTVTCIYEKRHKTPATDFLESKISLIKGGNVQFEKQYSALNVALN